MEPALYVLGFIAAVILGWSLRGIAIRRIIGKIKPQTHLRGPAVITKQRDDEPPIYYMIGRQWASKAEADADLERYRRSAGTAL